MSTMRLTGTTYAVLGLLAVQPWSTYELTQQMERTLGRVWPRAQSKLYEEPKKLVEFGLATAEDEAVGRRPRTVYTITDAGRQALAEWLREPGEGPVLEFEQLVKLSFADHGTQRRRLADHLSDLRVGTAAQRGKPRRSQGLRRRRRPIPIPRRPGHAGRRLLHRLLRHGRPLGNLGTRASRAVARKSR